MNNSSNSSNSINKMSESDFLVTGNVHYVKVKDLYLDVDDGKFDFVKDPSNCYFSIRKYSENTVYIRAHVYVCENNTVEVYYVESCGNELKLSPTLSGMCEFSISFKTFSFSLKNFQGKYLTFENDKILTRSSPDFMFSFETFTLSHISSGFYSIFASRQDDVNDNNEEMKNVKEDEEKEQQVILDGESSFYLMWNPDDVSYAIFNSKMLPYNFMSKKFECDTKSSFFGVVPTKNENTFVLTSLGDHRFDGAGYSYVDKSIIVDASNVDFFRFVKND